MNTTLDEQEQKELLRIKKSKERLKKIQEKKKRLQYGELLNICKEQEITLQELLEIAKKGSRYKREVLKDESKEEETNSVK